MIITLTTHESAQLKYTRIKTTCVTGVGSPRDCVQKVQQCIANGGTP